MLKLFLIVALHLCGEIYANSIYRGNNGWHQPNNFDQVINDFNSYHQKLQAQGFAPVQSPLFVLHNNANHLGQTFGPGMAQPVYHKPVYQAKPEYHVKPEHHVKQEFHHRPEHHQVLEHHKVPEHHHMNHHEDCDHHKDNEDYKKYTTTQRTTTQATTTQATTTTKHHTTHPTKGNHFDNLHDKKQHVVAAVTKPLEHIAETIHSKLPDIHNILPTHHTAPTAKPSLKEKLTEAQSAIFGNFQSQKEKVSEGVETIKDKIHGTQQVIANKLFDVKEKELEKVQETVDKVQDKTDDLLSKISAHTTKVFDMINKKLEDIEGKLQRLRPGAVKSIDDDEKVIEAIDDDMDEMRSLIDTVEADKDELRHEDVKSKVTGAFKSAHDKFNQMIEDKVAKVNAKINEVNEKIENLFAKLQSAVKKVTPTKKVYTPPTYKPTPPSVIDWKPKPTTWAPELNKYTINDYYRNENVTDDLNVDRMDTNGEEAAEIVDESATEGPVEEEPEDELALGEELRNEVGEAKDDLADLEDIDLDEEDLPESEIEEIEKVPINDEDSNAPTQANNLRFDELEVIQLIPVIIDQLRLGRVTASEMSSLEVVFGNLWPLMLAESERDVSGIVKMNPLLRTILNSEEVRLAKRDITAQIGNDIYKNSLRRVYRGDGGKSQKPYISLDDDRKLLSPSERLLNMVAAIVHKSNVAEKAKAKKVRQAERRKKQQRRLRNKQNPLGIVTIEKPKQRFVDRILSINRMKRSLIKFESDLVDMKALLEHVNHENDLVDNQDFNDDYMDDEDDFDYDYQQLPTLEALHENWYASRRFYDDYEDGSVNEFINLARQRDRREKNTAEWEDERFNEDDYDYDAYDEN